MAAAVYLLCGISSFTCALLLIQSYRRQRTRFLLASSLCFSGLAVSNIILFFDLVMFPDLDLLMCRQLITTVSLLALVWGFIWDIR